MNDYDIAVIGAGPGGYIAALKAAEQGARVAVIEAKQWGGTCLNQGCIPSKALLASAELLHKIRHADAMGVRVGGAVSFDWPAIQKRKDKTLATLRAGIRSLLTSRKVDMIEGRGVLSGPGAIAVTDADGSERTLRSAKTILATGSVPIRPPAWPDDPNRVCTTDEALHWRNLPRKLLIAGGGVIGAEFACMMQAFDVDVTVVEMKDRLIPEMDGTSGRTLASILAKRGVAIILDSKIDALTLAGEKVQAEMPGKEPLAFDRVLVAIGRRPNTENTGLDTVGIETDRRGFVPVDDTMRTAAKDVYCIGDANGRVLLAHAASAQAVTAVCDALGREPEPAGPIPWAVYTFPEAAGVGMTAEQAVARGHGVRIGTFPLGFLGKAMAAGETDGAVKVVADHETDALLGVHMLGHNATEIIGAAMALMTAGGKARDLGRMIFPHPTLGEALKEAAEDAHGCALHLPPRKRVRKAAASA